MNDKYKILRESLHELQREASAKGGHNPRSQMILDLLAERDALNAECEKLRKDAERYQWLRERISVWRNNGKGSVSYFPVTKVPASSSLQDETDAAIDAALAAHQQGGEE